MILYDPHLMVSFLDFGIQIPVRDSRAVKTFEALTSDPLLGPARHQWHQARILETLSKQDLLRVHQAAYVERLYSKELEQEIIKIYELIDEKGNYHRYAPEQALLPLRELFGRILIKAAGSVQCARLAMAGGFCFYFMGGMHHAHADYGSGFCPINDIVIAARKLQSEGLARQVWIIDVDAHKGDGTAALTAGDDTIRTLSIHMAEGWPLDGPKLLPDGRPNPVFMPSDIDIPIAPGEEYAYNGRLEAGLSALARLEPADLAIVVSGADPYEEDELPSTQGLRLTLQQMMARDQLVYNFLKARNVPGAYLMAGGYGDRVWVVYTQFLLWALKDKLLESTAGRGLQGSTSSADALR